MRTRIENCRFRHSVFSPGCDYQVVHKSQMSAFEVVGAFFIIHALASRLAIGCSHDKACMRQMTSEKLQYIIIGYGLLLNRYRIILVCIVMHRRND